MFRRWPSMRRYAWPVRPRDWAIVVLIVVGTGVAVVLSTYYIGMRRFTVPVATNQLRVGDCVKGKAGPVLAERVMRARCDGPHFGEVFAILTLPDTQDYPRGEALTRFGDNCGHKLFEYAPNIADGPTYSVAVGYPRAQAWANGDRTVVCVAMSKGQLWSPIAR